MLSRRRPRLADVAATLVTYSSHALHCAGVLSRTVRRPPILSGAIEVEHVEVGLI